MKRPRNCPDAKMAIIRVVGLLASGKGRAASIGWGSQSVMVHSHDENQMRNGRKRNMEKGVKFT